jgi:hypothetical protein
LTPFPDQQIALRKFSGRIERSELEALYFNNPFTKLQDADVESLGAPAEMDPLVGMVAARHRAMKGGSPRHVVFCMPKSGSTFTKAAVAHALDLPVVSLTGFGNTRISSIFGMNGREQEFDELAVIKSALVAPAGFVAQHHTRYTPYLALQLSAFGLQPIVTIRNILDILVSFDEMSLAAAPRKREDWIWDSPFSLPINYPEMQARDRYKLLGASLGVWLIQFYISWLRARRQGLVTQIVLNYEQDVLDPERFSKRISRVLNLDAVQSKRLREFTSNPDRSKIRFNVGRVGRGAETVPGDVREQLVAYVNNFRDEISEDDIKYLLG